MTKTSLAESLYLFNKIENLLRKTGAKGESFSDLVKSFDPYEKDNTLKKCRDFIDRMGSYFYYSKYNDTYYIKDEYEGITEDDELEKYRNCREKVKHYYAHRETLMDGFYNNLRIIGHERNQLLHKHNYTIPNFRRFKKACFQVIDYLESGKKPNLKKIVALNKSNQNEKKSAKASNLKSGIRTITQPSLWFLAKMAIVSMLLYYLMHKYGWCQWCSGVELAAVYGVGSIVGAFSLELIVIIAVGLFVEHVIPILVVFGFLYLLISCNESNRSTSGKHTYPASSSHSPQRDSSSDNTTCTYYYVKANKLNIRTKPTVKSYKNGQLRKNERVCVSRELKQWRYIEKKGWVLAKYLSKE